jgi:hypothetical protein
VEEVAEASKALCLKFGIMETPKSLAEEVEASKALYLKFGIMETPKSLVEEAAGVVF